MRFPRFSAIRRINAVSHAFATTELLSRYLDIVYYATELLYGYKSVRWLPCSSLLARCLKRPPKMRCRTGIKEISLEIGARCWLYDWGQEAKRRPPAPVITAGLGRLGRDLQPESDFRTLGQRLRGVEEIILARGTRSAKK